MKVLVAGWFSFEGMGATAGDLIARDLVSRWLDDAGRDYDVALAGAFPGGVDWRRVDPGRYSDVVFVCGPFGNGPPVTGFLERFGHARLSGVDLSMLQPLPEWNPFDLLLERDSSRDANPDITFLADPRRVPVVGRVLVHPQEEYGERAMHGAAEAAIRGLLETRNVAVVPIDTALEENETGLRTPDQVETLIARMDAVVTTRLHGMVLALKNGVPPVAVDPIRGGAKIRRQAETIGWPVLFLPEALEPAALREALDFCLSEKGRREARRCAERARALLEAVRARFVGTLGVGPDEPREGSERGREP